MKYFFLSFSIFCGSLFAQHSDVLFLGNSYTGVNNLPDLVYQLSLSGGDSIAQDSYTPGGYTFQMHSTDPNAIAKINARQWDFVVLQGQSQEPSLDTPYVVNNVFPYATQLNNMVHTNDSCTQTIFYMTWGRKNGDASNCAAYPPVCTYLGMQQQLENRYVQMANDNHAIVAPVGVAWRNVIATNPSYDLYMADESHPSLYGSYLTACVFYASIYRRSPAGILFNAGLPASDAFFLQTIAGQTVLDSLQLWNTEINYPDPSFIYTLLTPTTMNVINSDSSATSWYWNMGSGYFPGTMNDTLSFPSIGTYNICLAINNDCLADTSCHLVNITTVGIDNYETSSFTISPNPSNGTVELNFKTDAKYLISIYDAKGALLFQEIKFDTTENTRFDNLPNGILLFVVDSENAHFSKRILVNKN